MLKFNHMKLGEKENATGFVLQVKKTFYRYHPCSNKRFLIKLNTTILKSMLRLTENVLLLCSVSLFQFLIIMVNRIHFEISLLSSQVTGQYLGIYNKNLFSFLVTGYSETKPLYRKKVNLFVHHIVNRKRPNI